MVLAMRKSLQCYGPVLPIMLFHHRQPLPLSCLCAEPTDRVRIFRAQHCRISKKLASLPVTDTCLFSEFISLICQTSLAGTNICTCLWQCMRLQQYTIEVTFSVNELEAFQATVYTCHHNVAAERKVPQIVGKMEFQPFQL